MHKQQLHAENLTRQKQFKTASHREGVIVKQLAPLPHLCGDRTKLFLQELLFEKMAKVQSSSILNKRIPSPIKMARPKKVQFDYDTTSTSSAVDLDDDEASLSSIKGVSSIELETERWIKCTNIQRQI